MFSVKGSTSKSFVRNSILRLQINGTIKCEDEMFFKMMNAHFKAKLVVALYKQLI